LGLWAVESGLPPISNGGKHFKWLNKLLEKGWAAKGDTYHSEQSEAHLGFQFRLRLPNWQPTSRYSLR
jgi:hypothetical protein